MMMTMMNCTIFVKFLYDNNRDDIYGAVIMAKQLQEFTRFIWWIQTQRWGGRQPSDHRKKWQLPSTSTIAIYYYSARELILILPSYVGWKASLIVPASVLSAYHDTFNPGTVPGSLSMHTLNYLLTV